MPNLRARTIARAAVIVGGVDLLARKLAIPPEQLGRYLRGESLVPPEIFMRATEIVTDGGIAEVSKPRPTSEPKPRR
jgi:hypothetical protein